MRFCLQSTWRPNPAIKKEKKKALGEFIVSIRKEALHILDRFHIVAKMNKALDEVRAGESRRMAHEGQAPVVKKSRWLPLKREENLKSEQLRTLAASLVSETWGSARVVAY